MGRSFGSWAPPHIISLFLLVASISSPSSVLGASAAAALQSQDTCSASPVNGVASLVLEVCTRSMYRFREPINVTLTLTNVESTDASLRFVFSSNITGRAWSALTTAFSLCFEGGGCVFPPGVSLSETISFVTEPPEALLFWRNPAPPGEYLVEGIVLACHDVPGGLIACNEKIASSSVTTNLSSR